MQSEIQEGVAFFGRAGQALLKSLQRLSVDPLAVYGTNCLKFGTEEPADARGWLTRELHIVQPKLVVAMGGETVAFLNGLGFPLVRRARSRPSRRAPALHADDRRARDARHRRVAGRAEREDALLERLQGARGLVVRAPAVLRSPGARACRTREAVAGGGAAHGAGRVGRGRRPPASSLRPLGRRARRAAGLPGDVPRRLAAAPALRPRAGSCPSRSRPACSRCCSTWPGSSPRSTSRRSWRSRSSASGSCRCSRRSRGSCSSPRSIPWVDIASVYRGPTKVVVEQQPGIFERIAIAFPVPGEDGGARLGPAGRDLLRAVPRGRGALRPSSRRPRGSG